MLLNNQWITEEVKEKKMPRHKWKQNKKKKKHNDPKPMGYKNQQF